MDLGLLMANTPSTILGVEDMVGEGVRILEEVADGTVFRRREFLESWLRNSD